MYSIKVLSEKNTQQLIKSSTKYCRGNRTCSNSRRATKYRRKFLPVYILTWKKNPRLEFLQLGRTCLPVYGQTIDINSFLSRPRHDSAAFSLFPPRLAFILSSPVEFRPRKISRSPSRRLNNFCPLERAKSEFRLSPISKRCIQLTIPWDRRPDIHLRDELPLVTWDAPSMVFFFGETTSPPHKYLTG